MASLDRAFGYRGAVIALGMAVVAGAVQGVLAHAFDVLAVKIAIGVATALVLIMAGAISARRHLVSALGLGLIMGAACLVMRWAGWSLMEGGAGGIVAFVSALPLGLPAYLAERGISGFWMLEAMSMFIPALIGCYAGQERLAD
ncbi:MAG: hypothetical protein AAGB15_05570 [Pseudomonadota bacterium]